MKVLLVEDNKVVILGLKKNFSNYSEIELEVAENGFAALNLLSDGQNSSPNLILLDLNMPIMNGIEFLSHIKKIENLKSIPIVIHSTSNNISDIEKCYALGCSGYFTKEVDFAKNKFNIELIIDYWLQSKGPNILQNSNNDFRKTS